MTAFMNEAAVSEERSDQSREKAAYGAEGKEDVLDPTS